MAVTYSATGANTQNGGINQTNENRALTSYQINKGDTLYGIAKKYNTSVNNIQALNPGLNPTALKIGTSLKLSGTPAAATPTATQPAFTFNPTSYSQLMTPGQVQQYASNQAMNQYNSQKLGFDQNIARYQQQINQLQSDDAIKKDADSMARLKYADALLGVDANLRDGQANYQNNILDLQRALQSGTSSLNKESFEAGQNAKQSMSDRGLYHSSILDGRMGEIDRSKMEGISSLQTNYQDNMSKVNNEMTALVNNLNAQKTSLTQRQQEEMVNRINELQTTRNNLRGQYQLQIDQQRQNIQQADKDRYSYQDQLFQDMYGKYADMYRDDRDAAEDKRRWELEYALKKQQANNSWGGYSYYGGGGSGGGSSSTTKSTAGKTTSATRAEMDAALSKNGSITLSNILKAGKGPLSVNYAQSVVNKSNAPSTKKPISIVRQTTPQKKAVNPTDKFNFLRGK